MITAITCVRSIRKIKQEFHDFVCVPPLAVGQEECFSSRLLNIVENLWQAIILFYVFCQVLDRHGLEITLDVDVVHCPPNILEQGFVREHHRSRRALEPISCSK